MVLDFSSGDRTFWYNARTDGMKEVLAILFLLPLAARRAGVRSVLQVDFGVDTYVRADHVFERAGVFVERLSVPLVGNRSLDDIAQAACAATERRPGADRVRPEPGRTRDRALRAGVAGDGNARPLRQSAPLRQRTQLPEYAVFW